MLIAQVRKEFRATRRVIQGRSCSRQCYSPFSNLLTPLVSLALTNAELRLLLNPRHKFNLTIATPIRHRPLPLPIILHNRIRPAHIISPQPTTREPRRKGF